MGFEKVKPAYSGGSIAIWEGVVENGANKGKKYLKVRIFGHTTNCFAVEEVKRE